MLDIFFTVNKPPRKQFYKLRNQVWKLLILCLICLFSGCAEPTIEDHYNEYLTRLARVLDQDLPSWEATDTRVGLLDFIALTDSYRREAVSTSNGPPVSKEEFLTY